MKATKGKLLTMAAMLGAASEMNDYEMTMHPTAKDYLDYDFEKSKKNKRITAKKKNRKKNKSARKARRKNR